MVRFLVRGKILLLSTESRPALILSQPSIQEVPGAVTSAVERPGYEANNSLPSSAFVKGAGAIPPFPHMSS
jgi:hypothetical protein